MPPEALPPMYPASRAVRSMPVDSRTPSMTWLEEVMTSFTSREESLIVEVMRLPRRLREATLLYYYHGMDEREIAEALGMAPSSVRVTLKHARENLRRILEPVS